MGVVIPAGGSCDLLPSVYNSTSKCFDDRTFCGQATPVTAKNEEVCSIIEENFLGAPHTGSAGTQRTTARLTTAPCSALGAR